MTPVFSTVLTIAIVIAASLLFIIAYHLNRQKKTGSVLAVFRKVAAGLGFSVSRQQALSDMVIGLDDVNSKLLFLKLNGNEKNIHLVDLKDVKSSTVKKTYAPLTYHGIEMSEVIQTIGLLLNYKNETRALVLPFYTKNADPVHEIKERAEMAKTWQSFLSTRLTHNNTAYRNVYASANSREVNVS